MFGLTPYDKKYTVSSYNPFSELENMQKAFFGENSLAEFKTDIKDVGESFVLEADLPGFKKEDIKIDLDEDYMTISAQRHSEYEEKDKKGNYVRCERSYGSYARRFDVSGIKTEDISASYNDGVLKLNLPKREENKPVSRRLEIN